ncbi:hypothetical protein BD309DRAFT_1085159 [Dichomitus squalens]|uniref:Uncharacterized protein n=1 Tax=Dichomitus squalens TaxID=114155 RepID=A0A4Q9NAK0_9APHY|nr:hypothetical protein BD309DRAFT_1085159 [Dichomitus squalens]TBU57192.1 hypothetical protein BD310DRAFT_929848 [Dichomitus squalens]
MSSVPTSGAAAVSARPPTTPEQWEQTLAQLRATNEELQRRRAEAEKDRDLFRDLYSKASSHASEVTKENNELAERAALAETQTHDGVAMIKATYEERIRLLEREVERWKKQIHVLTERDGRMDDEIRRRAALEPELRAENVLLRAQLEHLEEDYARLEGLLEKMTKQQIEETIVLGQTATDSALSIKGIEAA